MKSRFYTSRCDYKRNKARSQKGMSSGRRKATAHDSKYIEITRPCVSQCDNGTDHLRIDALVVRESRRGLLLKKSRKFLNRHDSQFICGDQVQGITQRGFAIEPVMPEHLIGQRMRHEEGVGLRIFRHIQL